MDTFETFWHYHSEAPAVRPAKSASPPVPGIRALFAANYDEATHFELSFLTQRLRPNHRVTLRTSVTGWGRDLHGTYWYGTWRFVLPKTNFPNGCEFKFLLDDGIWNLGDNFSVDHPESQFLGEDRVHFPESVGERFIHGYENLRVSEDQQQQSLLRTDLTEQEDWDVIVIGSGMGGGVLADALTDLPDKQLKVLVLDAGSFDYPSHVDNLPVTALGRVIGGHGVRHYENEPNTNTQFGEFVQMNLGGRSVFWSGLIPRMRYWELVNWPDSIHQYLTAQGGYDAAEKLMRKHVAAGRFQEDLIGQLQKQFPTFDVVNTPRSSHQPEFGPEGSPVQHPESFHYRSTGTFSTAELLLDSLTNYNDPGRGQLFINCNHLVTELEHNGQRITGVVCQDLVGDRRRVFHGKHVVLAAGSIESPKIALLSQLRDPQGKIGVGLTDHPSYFAPNRGDFRLRADSPFAGPYRHARIFFYPRQQWEGHWFNVEIVINGQYWRSRHADDEILAAEHPPDASSSVHFKCAFSSPLQEENWVRLGGSDGKVKVRIPGNPSGDQARGAVVSLLQQLFDFLRVEPVDLSNDDNCHFGNGGTPAHAGGTLRMPSPTRPDQRSVVDENLKFDAYENLYACDPSVYPYIPAANPSLTLTALALRLARHLGSLP